MAEKWRLQGTLFDACNCTTLCPCNYLQNPSSGDCRPAVVWHITDGNYGKTKLGGLNFAAVLYAAGNPLHGIDKLVLILDAKAKDVQRKALMSILGGQAGGMWEMMAKIVKATPEVLTAPFEYKNDGKAWRARADGYLEVRGGFVKAPAEMGIPSKPKKAQTYDFLFSPTMEKVVGTSDTFRANAGGLSYDFSGKYSSSGRFDYKGP